MFASIASLVTALAIAGAQLPDEDTLFLDLDQTEPSNPIGSQPRALVGNGSVAYFSAYGPDGRELFVSDGATEGTVQVADSWSGAGGALSFASIEAERAIEFLPGAGDGAVLGLRADGVGIELHRVDGADLTLLRDIAAGPSSSTPEDFTPFQGAIWFVADDGVHGREVWRTDGSAAGTQLAVDLSPGGGSLFAAPGATLDGRLAALGNGLLIAADAGPGFDLWHSDGTAAGSSQVASFPGALSGHPFNHGFHGVGGSGAVFAIESDDPALRGLWGSDGTAGGTTLLVPDVEVVWAVGDGQIAFACTERNSDVELYASDGTPAGTVRLMGPGLEFDAPRDFRGVFFEGELFLSAIVLDPVLGNLGVELVRSDGTPTGTVMAADLVPGLVSSAPGPFGVHAGELYFFSSGLLYRSDGTAAGTALVGDPNPLQFNILFGDYGVYDVSLPMVSAEEGLLFPLEPAQEGGELYVGHPGGLSLLADLSPGETDGSRPRDLGRSGNRLYFSAEVNGDSSRELVSIDVDGSGPAQLIDVNGDPFDLWLSAVAPWRGGAVFGARIDGLLSDHAVWWFDGNQVVRLTPDPLTTSVSDIWVAEDRVFFQGSTEAGGFEYFVSDGAPLSAEPVELASGVPIPFVAELAVFGNRIAVAFASTGAASVGASLAITDGTPEGTDLIALMDGASHAHVRELAMSGGRLFIAAETAPEGYELWSSDGTDAGTTLLLSAPTGESFVNIAGLTAFQGGVAFTYEVSNQRAPYYCDGTVEGSEALLPMSFPSFESGRYYDAGTSLMFDWGFSVRSLYRSDGTAAGTVELEQHPDELGDGFAELVRPLGSDTVLARVDGPGGWELWEIDGSPSGNRPLADSWPGFEPSTEFFGEDEFLFAAGRLYFVAESPGVGEELHAIELGDSGTDHVQSILVGCGSASAGLTLSGTPAIGQAFSVELDAAQSAVPAALLLGTDLLPFGPQSSCAPVFPASINLGTTLTSTAGHATYPLAIPADTALIGLPLYLRGVAVAAGEPFLGLASLSNVLEIVVGG